MSRALALIPTVTVLDERPQEQALGGAIEGAERINRETFSWNPAIISPDRQINPVKEMADVRARDSIQNDGYATGAINIHRDSIVGSQYRINAQPDWRTLGATKEWAEKFQQVMESRFNLLADSQECWFDASGSMTFTGLIRLGVGGFVMTGEVLATAEWIREIGRPFNTALQMISPSRLNNPDGLPDDQFLRRGVVHNLFGKATDYWIKVTHPNDIWGYREPYRALEYKKVPARKPWGRRQVIHITDPLQPDQTRGIADMVSVLKQMRMTKKFQDVVLQNAVVKASYAAAVESEMPPDAVFAAMGAGQQGFGAILGDYMTALSSYVAGSSHIQVDGVKMPHLFPGTKISMQPMGAPGGVGDQFEQSLLRHIAAGMGLSYEQLSRDYSQTNYSSARASMAETWKGMQSKKKNVADRLATSTWILWLEEQISMGDVPLPPNFSQADFYDPLKREALCKCSWIGASRGQIDEMKETQSAILRMQNGLSTLEAECARLGEDYRPILEQLAREAKMKKELGLVFGDGGAEKPGANDAQQVVRGNKGKATAEQEDDEL